MNNFLKTIIKYGKKIDGLIGKNFDSNPYYGHDDNKYITTKIKTFKDSIITNFHNKKVPEEKIPYKCSSIIVLDSIIKSKINKKFYPQTYLDECIYKEQKQKRRKQQQKNYITEELKSDSDSDDESESESVLDSDSNDESDSGSNDE